MPIRFSNKGIGRGFRNFDSTFKPANEFIPFPRGSNHRGLFAVSHYLPVGRRIAASHIIRCATLNINGGGDGHVLLELGSQLHHIGRGIGDGHLHMRQRGALDTVFLPAHKVVTRVGNGVKLGNGALEVNAPAFYDAASLRLSGGDDFCGMITLGFIGVAVVLVLLENLLNFFEGLTPYLYEFFDSFRFADFDDGRNRDWVDEFAEATSR